MHEQITLDMDAAEGTAMYGILKNGTHEYETTAVIYWILKNINPSLFVDVGANIGFYSALVGKVATSINVVSVEASPNLATVVQKFCESNGVTASIKNIALGIAKGTGSFYISKSDCSNSLREGFREAKEVIHVDIDTLDSLLEPLNPSASLIKIDTETTEGDVLLGGRNWITAHRPFLICEVLQGLEDARIPLLLREIGYTPYQILPKGITINNAVDGEPTYKFRDYLFSPRLLATEEVMEINSLITTQ